MHFIRGIVPPLALVATILLAASTLTQAQAPDKVPNAENSAVPADAIAEPPAVQSTRFNGWELLCPFKMLIST